MLLNYFWCNITNVHYADLVSVGIIILSIIINKLISLTYIEEVKWAHEKAAVGILIIVKKNLNM